MNKPLIAVEVAYAKPAQQVILKLSLPEGATIREAIQQSGILERFPEINLDIQPVGVFSQIRQLGDEVRAGERIEIYRPLEIDPKDARRLRVRAKKRG